MTAEGEAEDTEIGWMRPYVAGAFDWAGTLHVKVKKKGSYKLGYALEFQIKMQKTEKTAVGLIDEFCEALGFTPNLRIEENEGKSDVYVLTIASRDDIRAFLEGVFPFLVVRHEQVEILLEHVFPMIEDGDHRNKRGWLDLMYYIDEYREASSERGMSRQKYDLEYFQQEWDMR